MTKFIKTLWHVTCPTCGKFHTLQAYVTHNNLVGRASIGMVESDKSLKEMNDFLDRKTKWCSCGTLIK